MERATVATLGGRVLVIPYVFHEDVFFEYFEPYRHPEANFDDIWDGIGLELSEQILKLFGNLTLNMSGQLSMPIAEAISGLHRACGM